MSYVICFSCFTLIGLLADDVVMATTSSQIGLGSTGPSIPQLGSKTNRRRKVVGRLGPWQLLRLLDEGETTRVYLARPADVDAEEAALYAIKSLRKEWWTDSQAIEAQRRHAWVGQRVSHPNLVPVLSASIASPPFYVVMPRIEGQTAEKMLAKERPSVPVALWIARQTAEALASLHEKTGMIHGDLKPSNLMVGPDGHTTLIDFGFCQTETESRAWADRAVVGTLHYMAPERLTSANNATVQSDLYSLGVTLYEFLTGHKLFDSDHPGQLISMHREERPRQLSELLPDLPPTVSNLVNRLLSKASLRRAESASQVAEELRRLEIECFGMR